MPASGRRWRRKALAPVAVCWALALQACAAHYLQVPPRVDLAPYGQVALVTFLGDNADSGMTGLATRRFSESVLNGQGRVALLELPAGDTLLNALAERGVAAVFLGTLALADPHSTGHFSLSNVSVRQTVTAELSVRLVSTSSGATLWRSSARTDGTLGRASLSGLRPSVSIRDKDEAYGELVDRLIATVAQDFHPTWVKE